MIFTDNLKKESKYWFSLSVISYFFMALAAVSFGNNPKFETKDVVLICVWCGMVGSLSLYGGLYYFVYRLKVTEDGVYLRTIFKKQYVQFGCITEYEYKRYNSSRFYLFTLHINGKRKTVITTRFCDEMILALQDAGISEKKV